MLHKLYFKTTNNSGWYAGPMRIKSHVSECKLFSGRLSRKFFPAFKSECCAYEILKNLLLKKQLLLFVMFHDLKFIFHVTKIKSEFCATVKFSVCFEETGNSKMLSCFR